MSNGCYQKNQAISQCQQIGCDIDDDKNTFKQVCFNKELTTPADLPDCPPSWVPETVKVASTGAGGGSATGSGSAAGSSACSSNGVVCIPMPTTSTPAPTTTTAQSTGQSTTPNTTLPPFEHIGNGGCPEGFTLEHNNGSLFFDCPFRDYTGGASCGVSCDEYGNCTTTCSNSPEDNCQDALTSGTVLNFHFVF